MTINKKMDLGSMPLKPDNSHFTDGQWQAIYDEGDNILVSASAGSGKTTVLVQRVIEKIKAGINVNELLIVTYTEAAAKEMKGRIQEAIQQSITTESNQELKNHLVNQLTLIPTAHVSTLHAFCLQVIRKYYYLINIDPVFRLLTDETEMILLKEEVWDDLRSGLYEKQEAKFYELTAMFSNDRNDDGLTKLIFALYDFARANPDPDAWLKSLANAYQVGDNLAEIPIYQDVLKEKLVAEANYLVTNAEEMVRLSEGEPVLEKVYQCVASELPSYQQLQSLLAEDKLTEVYTLLQTGITSQRYPSLRNLEAAEKEVNTQIKYLRDNNKDTLANWQSGIFSLAPDKMVAIMADSKEIVSYMAEVAQLFATAYLKRKEEIKLLDFNDLEHFTLKILAEVKDGNWFGTEASNYYRSVFQEILVDEYQDINQLQESILFWLRQPAEGAGNLFMVGDVKQSIYSFRLADPTLFIDKYIAFGRGENGRRIILAENFRSRGSVLDFTNLVFQQLMDIKLGQLDYDKPAELITGFSGYPESDQVVPEILIFESAEEDQFASDDVDESFQINSKSEGELRLVGNKIKEMFKDDYQIFDKKNKILRKIQYSDIVLLSPTKKNNLILLEIFKELNIPIEVNDTQNYFQATEIKIMMSLLNIIDNPFQDIPFVSVLRSPIVGIKENDLAFIRSQDQNGSFYDSFKATLNLTEDRHNKELLAKLAIFNQQLHEWRELARRKELVQLIWTIYDQTGFLDYVGGMSAGKQRQVNLHALYQRAASYEEMSFKGLFQFIRFIEKMSAKDKDLAEPTDLSERKDAVQVMTIHASKGLEFPVVFVLDLTRKFNLMDLNQNYLFDVGLGAGIKYTDITQRLVYKTLPFLAIHEVKKNKLLSEEMRKLYVALTRAEEKLFLVGSYKNQVAAFKKWSTSANEKDNAISETTRMKASSLMDWIGMTLMRHDEMKRYQNEVEIAVVPELKNHQGQFKLSFYDLSLLREVSSQFVEPIKVTASASTVEILDKLDKEALATSKLRLDYQYPELMATKTAGYQSVSEIKRVFEDPDNAELLTLDLSQGESKLVNRYVSEELAKPAFLTNEKTISGADIGTATHLLMQLMPIDVTPTVASLTNLITELVAKKLILAAVAEQIEVEKLVAFYMSEFGQEVISQAQFVKRESPFSLLLKATDIYLDYPQDSQDTLLVHGIIDGYIETSDELILYDFKTDQVSNVNNIEKLQQKYSGQLRLYRQALEEAKGRPVTAVKLILLATNQTIDMPIES